MLQHAPRNPRTFGTVPHHLHTMPEHPISLVPSPSPTQDVRMWGSKVPQLVLDKLTDVIFPVLGIQAKEGASHWGPLRFLVPSPSSLCALSHAPDAVRTALHRFALPTVLYSAYRGELHATLKAALVRRLLPGSEDTPHAHGCRPRDRHVAARHAVNACWRACAMPQHTCCFHQPCCYCLLLPPAGYYQGDAGPVGGLSLHFAIDDLGLRYIQLDMQDTCMNLGDLIAQVSSTLR